jgi:hypothetical protein
VNLPPVALTEKKIKDLEDKKFDELYENKKSVWTTLATTAQKHAKDNITGGKAPRSDDIAKVLHPMLEINRDLRAHQDEYNARGKRYVEWFVEYVIDQSL